MKIITHINIGLTIHVNIRYDNSKAISEYRTVDAGLFCYICKLYFHHFGKDDHRKRDW